MKVFCLIDSSWAFVYPLNSSSLSRIYINFLVPTHACPMLEHEIVIPSARAYKANEESNLNISRAA